MANRSNPTEPTARDSSGEFVLAALTASSDDDDLDAFAEWGGDVIADGTPPREPTPAATLARGSAPTTAARQQSIELARSRTATHHDPLTTAVLAQIARDAAADDPKR